MLVLPESLVPTLACTRRGLRGGAPVPVRGIAPGIAGALALALAVSGGLAGTAHADGLLEKAVGAPEGLTLEGGVRLRVEGIDGQFRPARAKDDAMFSLKTTLLAQYETDGFRIGGELWDARGYGEKRTSSAGTTEINAMELVQLYAGFDVRTGASSKAEVTAGRFTLNVGSRRLVARQAFRNTTNAYTGARFVWKDAAGDQLIGFWSMPLVRLPDGREDIQDNKVEWDKSTSDLQLYGLHLTKGRVLGGALEVYGFGLDERDGPGRQTRNRHLYTPGLRLVRKPKAGRLDYDLEGAYQFGTTRATVLATDTRDLDVSAYFLHGEAGYTFPGGWKPRLSAHFDVASGDGRGKTYTRFDTLYGARRFDYGPTGLYGAVGRYNVISPSLRIEAKPDGKSDFGVAWRPLWLESASDSFAATGVRDASGASGRFAGHQVEARYRRTLVPDLLHFDTGFAYLAKGGFLKDAPNAPRTGDTRYGYFDLYFDF